MTLEEFDQLIMAELEKFKAYWLKHQKEYEDWPEEMDKAEWLEQFAVWLEKYI